MSKHFTLGMSKAKELMERYSIDEAADVSKIIKELIDTDFGGSNADQGKGIELLKGLAFSDEDMSNKFMTKLNAAYTKIGKEVLGE